MGVACCLSLAVFFLHMYSLQQFVDGGDFCSDFDLGFAAFAPLA